MDIEKMEERKDFFDKLINFLGEDENAPMEFRIMKAHRDLGNAFSAIMTNKAFLKMNDDNELKQTVLKFFEEGTNLLKEISSKIN